MIDVSPFIERLDGKPVAVFGLALSGLSVISALQAAGADIIAWDDNEAARAEAAKLGADVQDLDADIMARCGALVLAPGVPLYYPEPHDVVKVARAAGVEILCDIEIFYRSVKDLADAPVLVGITGTNGKSTTTALAAHVLSAIGLKAVMAGNIGVPVLDLDLIDLEGGDARGVVVLELSSYQLDLCETLALDIAVFLNLSPDHLDRHGSMARYFDAKARIFEGSKVQLVCVDDESGQDMFTRVGGLSFMGSFDAVADIQNAALQGVHNKQNMAATLMIARELEGADADIQRALESFPGLAHRQYVVRAMGDVLYVNDSKATNAEAAARALSAYENQPIFWIAGGQAKDGGLEALEPYLGAIAHAFLIGEAAKPMAEWLKERGVTCTLCGKLEVALQSAHMAAQGAGRGVVLLSPACASWDQFSSFEARGDLFVELVDGL